MEDLKGILIWWADLFGRIIWVNHFLNWIIFFYFQQIFFSVYLMWIQSLTSICKSNSTNQVRRLKSPYPPCCHAPIKLALCTGVYGWIELKELLRASPLKFLSDQFCAFDKMDPLAKRGCLCWIIIHII